MKFVKQSELELLNGNYLYAGNSPVTNKKFVVAQLQAEYIITLAKAAKGKAFEDVKGYTIEELHADTSKLLSKKTIEFVKTLEAPKSKLFDDMKTDALAFITHAEDSEKVTAINDYMQSFEVLYDFEKNGLFFEEGIQKLDKIYTIEEILKALNKVINLINN